MSARYIFRFDDITPRMNWEKFWALFTLLRTHNIIPLLGIIPDNHDITIDVSPPHRDFWGMMRRLRDEDLADFAQHGYQHILSPTPHAAILGPELGIKEMSEFAGFSYETQLAKIQLGKQILDHNEINTTTWMAPNHTFDSNTLAALRHEGFRSVTDGIAMYPYESDGLIFVPQQSWRPRWMPFGVQTICIHTNEVTPRTVKALRHFLRRPYHFSRFTDELRRFESGALQVVFDKMFQVTYRAIRRLKRSGSPRFLNPATPLPSETDSLLATVQPLPSHQGN